MNDVRTDYAFEKCVQAAEWLSVSHDPLWKRLADAWGQSLIRLHADNTPADAWEKFAEFRSYIHANVPAGATPVEGAITSVLRSATDVEVSKLAQLLWNGIAHVFWNLPPRR